MPDVMDRSRTPLLLLEPHPGVGRAPVAEPAPVWCDTVPTCFRSEAFAEDLFEGHDTTAEVHGSTSATPRFTSLAVLPGLAAALALTLGWIGSR
jgi:hypothetical protein